MLSENVPGWREMEAFLGSTGLWSHREAKRAALLAATVHAGQQRKYTHEPYIVHPISVATVVWRISHEERGAPVFAIAGLLHDTIEDTAVTSELLEELEVPAAARWLTIAMTDVEKPSEGNRAARHKLKCERMRQRMLGTLTLRLSSDWSESSVDAEDMYVRREVTRLGMALRGLKMADLVDNSHSIVEHDPKFAKVYMAEMPHMIDALEPSAEMRELHPTHWSDELARRAREVVATYRGEAP